MDSQEPEDRESTPEPRYEPGLEQKFILEFFQERGLTPEHLKALPADEARQLRIEACMYATARLAELEARARFVGTIHDAAHNTTT